MYTIAFGIKKGGVGKTSLSLAFAAYLHRKGKRVLLIDADSQGSATSTLNGSKDGVTLTDVLNGSVPASQAIIPSATCDLIAGNLRLVTENPVPEGEFKRLKDAISPLKAKYDYCIIDCCPSFGMLMSNALVAADGLVIPVLTDVYSMESLDSFMVTVNEIRKRLNKKLHVLGIAVNMYEARSTVNQGVLELIREQAEKYGTKVFSPVRKGIAVRESQATYNPDFFSYAARSGVAADYKRLFEEILKEVDE